ncbi:ferredoxin oxidoreductase [Candidatus Berkelbacteria bacterium CG10_big_fil_rev_8_21_14_0_10_43_13]|uniref:Ferredoxin oxidoreductase n=1 Tax=Candidatus Berkelbacteria bacterium CG10_big_fil_rev_8_21_14_0_10_43_13 TaxID=1974514 RepID=A0A2H0W6F4_9BACT|nr:MAG: ferredoxin oxidoreductase [Candidatus Berkelbacteria bacterium CG10_big_fil_rev_8_21_14_0_10_43_13]
MAEKIFITGNEAAVRGAVDAGAKIMFGYPITPATEILEGWIAQTVTDKSLQYLQTEDEIAAGFGVLGAVLGGAKAFTASAGIGHVLLQDPVAMAENMRLPFVGIMMQRGGPSTGTVNFSQQEVNLAIHGGNGDSFRIVYSASNVEEMYSLVIKAFSAAWKYRFPTFVLGDGYLGKMKATVELKKLLKPVESKPILSESGAPTWLRNCFSSEEELNTLLNNHITDWEKNKNKIVESESFHTNDARYLVIAHGLVASATKETVLKMRHERIRIGLFRPITLNPFDGEALRTVARGAKHIFIVESAYGQLGTIAKAELAGHNIKAKISQISKPAEGFTPEEILKEIKKHNA